MEDRALGTLFISALSRFRKMGASYPVPCDLQLVEWTILQQAAHCDCGAARCLNVGEIQQTLHISRPGVSQCLSSLERKGYIIRQLDKTDRRKVAVEVTVAGREKLDETRGLYERMMQGLMAEFGEDNLAVLCEKLHALAEVYEKLACEMSDGEPAEE